MDKKSLRIYIKEEKRRHPATELSEEDARLCREVLDNRRVKEADVVLLYWSLPDEVCTHGLVETLAATGKTVLLPRVAGDTELTLHRFTSVGDMVCGAYGILEPAGEAVGVEELTRLLRQEKGCGGTAAGMVGIIPGMAFDASGHRLGRGKGYYDRLLAKVPWLYTIGLCYPFQLLDSVPADGTDVVMAEVIC